MRLALCSAILVFALPALADDAPAVKEISTKDLKLVFPEGTKATEPATIKSAEELAKSPALKDAVDAIQKEVNFEKEKLLFFAWSGSGRDQLTPDAKTSGTFTLTRGRTRDLRRHMHLFVVPKDVEVKVLGN